MLSTSMADNVISYKKIKRNTQINKNAVEWFSLLFQMHFHVPFKVCLSRKTFSTGLTRVLSWLWDFLQFFKRIVFFSYLKHQCSHTGKFHAECFSVLYVFSCDCCTGLHHFLSHHITYTERACHCVSCTGAVPITPGWEIFLSTCCKRNPSWCSR